MKKGIAVICVILMLSVMISCEKKSDAQTAAESKEPIRIGMITELSGILEEWGLQESRSLRLGIEYATNGTFEINGRPIELIIEDTACNPATGVQKITKLIEKDNVDILTGSCSSSIVLSTMEKAKEYQIPYLVNCGASDDITGKNRNNYTFRIGRTLRQETMTCASVLKEAGIKDLVFIAPDYAGGRASVAALKYDYELLGIKILSEIFAPLDTTDFTPYLAQVKDLDPEALWICPIGPNFSAKLPQQIIEFGLEESIQILGAAEPITWEILGDHLLGQRGSLMYYPTMFDNKYNDFLIKRFEEEYQIIPELWAANAFTGGMALVKVLSEAASLSSADLVTELENLEMDSIKGTITMRKEDHQAMQDMPIVELKKIDGYDYPVPVLVDWLKKGESDPPVYTN